jgi:hypothetical protein
VKSALGAVLFASIGLAASAPIREVTTEFPLVGLQPAPYFRHGRVFQLLQVLKVYERDGTFAFYAPIRTPDGNLTTARDISVDSDDSFVVATNQGLALLDSRGLQTGFIKTNGFWVGHVVITEDHSIWVLGHSLRPKGDYTILRKYSREGALLGSWLPSSTFAPGVPEPGYEGGRTRLMASGNEIAVAAGGDLIHLDGDGKVLGRMRLDKSMKLQEFAFTSDGRFYGWGIHDGLVLFDLDAVTCKKVETPYPYGFFGSDEATLVFYKDKGDGMTTVFWFNQPD